MYYARRRCHGSPQSSSAACWQCCSIPCRRRRADAAADAHAHPAGARRPAPAPAPAALSIKLERTQRVGHDRVIVRGKKVRVRGTLAPFVAGQRVSVRLFRGSHRVRQKTVAVGPAARSPPR
jgi:hypothetical protein